MSTVILSLHVNGGCERAGPIRVYCLFMFISFAEYCYPQKRSHYVRSANQCSLHLYGRMKCKDAQRLVWGDQLNALCGSFWQQSI